MACGAAVRGAGASAALAIRPGERSVAAPEFELAPDVVPDVVPNAVARRFPSSGLARTIADVATAYAPAAGVAPGAVAPPVSPCAASNDEPGCAARPPAAFSERTEGSSELASPAFSPAVALCAASVCAPDFCVRMTPKASAREPGPPGSAALCVGNGDGPNSVFPPDPPFPPVPAFRPDPASGPLEEDPGFAAARPLAAFDEDTPVVAAASFDAVSIAAEESTSAEDNMDEAENVADATPAGRGSAAVLKTAPAAPVATPSPLRLRELASPKASPVSGNAVTPSSLAAAEPARPMVIADAVIASAARSATAAGSPACAPPGKASDVVCAG